MGLQMNIQQNQQTDPEFILNEQGAKVYLDPSNHLMLNLPTIKDISETGDIRYVLSVGFHYGSYMPCVTIQHDNEPVLYLLPSDLANWVRHTLAAARQGETMLPTNVEFGILGSRQYAEFL